MAFSDNALFCNTWKKIANHSSVTDAINNTHAVGKLVVVCVAVDNNQTTDGDEGAVSSITDSTGSNTWTKAKEFTNGQGSAQAGTTCSVWYSVLTAQLSAASDTVTVNFTNASDRDASAMTGRSFTFTGSSVEIAATNTVADDAPADYPSSLDAATVNIECLRIRAWSFEHENATISSLTSGWTGFNGTTSASTTSGAAASNQGIGVEFKISTGTGDASDPTQHATGRDSASCYVAFKEVNLTKAPPFSNPIQNFQPFLAR